MGILDEVTSAVNRGTASAGRAAEKVKLKSQVDGINKKRQQLAAQLGASLYEATRNDEALRRGREALYDGIAACDVERDALQQQIAELDAQAAASLTLVCPVCGAGVGAADLFCSGCGTSMDQIRAQGAGARRGAADGQACTSCGAPMGADDLFCMSCGAKVVAAEAAEQPEEPSA